MKSGDALLHQAIVALNKEYVDSFDFGKQEHVFVDYSPALDVLHTKFARQVADSQFGRVCRELSGVRDSRANRVKVAIVRQERCEQIGDVAQNASAFEKDTANLNRVCFWRTSGRPAVVVSVVSLVSFVANLFLRSP
jgi:hypothetical protein